MTSAGSCLPLLFHTENDHSRFPRFYWDTEISRSSLERCRSERQQRFLSFHGKIRYSDENVFYPWHGILQDGTPDRAEQAEEQEEGGYGKQHVGEGIEELTGTARSAS